MKTNMFQRISGMVSDIRFNRWIVVKLPSNVIYHQADKNQGNIIIIIFLQKCATSTFPEMTAVVYISICLSFPFFVELPQKQSAGSKQQKSRLLEHS